MLSLHHLIGSHPQDYWLGYRDCLNQCQDLWKKVDGEARKESKEELEQKVKELELMSRVTDSISLGDILEITFQESTECV